jgi:hypothetical protein
MSIMAARRPKNRWSTCNVLQTTTGTRRLWQFTAAGGDAHPAGSFELTGDQPLPKRVADRGWRHLFQPALNVAWLPADHLHLRVVHVPRCEPEELRSMIELQLEKLSPAPVNQVVWSFETFPHPDETLQTVVVSIAERADVEAYLGLLEQGGYLADRLTIPWLHQVLGAAPGSDGTWIYLVPRDMEVLCLAAWWYQGALQHVDLLRLPQEEGAPAMLVDHLTRVAWGAEIDGWLMTPPVWHLVSNDPSVERWAEVLTGHFGETPQLHAGLSITDLARLTARRALRNEPVSNLLPAEFAAGYQQRFVDRLWMRGLGAVILLYLVGLVFYFGAIQVLDQQRTRLQREVRQLSGSYTNALQLKERVRLFEDQAELRYAALDSLRAVSDLLPPELTLTSFRFTGGKAVSLAGTVPAEHQLKVTEYNAELRNVSVNGVPIFRRDGVQPPNLTPLPGVGYRWLFNAELHRTSSP